MSKHILNSSKTLVSDALAGLAFLNPAVQVFETTLSLRSPKLDQVALICGGGSGHEPSHAGFVGEGMLSAAVCGQVFASPNSRQVEEVLEEFSAVKGVKVQEGATTLCVAAFEERTVTVLIVVKNYTGDVLQFGLAKEKWAASRQPTADTVRIVIVGDDVAVPRSSGVLTGRRGLAATVLVYKIAGALAATGASLDEVEFIAQLVADRSGTIGIGLEHCHVPGTEKSQAYLTDDEVEVGMGIHNEPGNRKIAPIPSASKLVEEMITTLIDTDDKERGYLAFKKNGKDEVILLVNNLGGLPEVELGVVVKEACECLARNKITVQRVLAGTFMTSLNLPGFSISLVLLPPEPATPSMFSSKLVFDKDIILELLDAPTEAPGFKWHYKGKPEAHIVDPEKKTLKPVKKEQINVTRVAADPKLFIAAIEAAMKAVSLAEPDITRYDTIAGDGDAGLTLKAGAEAIQSKINEGGISSNDIAAAFVDIAGVVDDVMGGTSGGLFSIFFSGLAKGLLQAQREQDGTAVATSETWARGLDLALNTLYRYTRARPPSRTLVDPLASFIVTFSSNPSNIAAAFAAAKEGAEATRSLEATAGRAAYVSKEKISAADVPDAGAWGVFVMLDAVQGALQSRQ